MTDKTAKRVRVRRTPPRTFFCGTFQYRIAIQREHWHKGYATEAIRLVLAYFFRELSYQKVTVGIYAFNEASIKLHEKLGFRHEDRADCDPPLFYRRL